MKRVLIPSLFIIYPPNSRKHLERSFMCFFTFPYWIKEKSMETLAKPQHLRIQMQNTQVISPTVSHIQLQALNYKISQKVIHKGKMVIYILKSQTLTSGSKSTFKNHISSRHEVCFIRKIVRQDSCWKSQNSKYLEFFLSV